MASYQKRKLRTGKVLHSPYQKGHNRSKFAKRAEGLYYLAMAKIQPGDLHGIREKHRDKKIVFVSGGFDLTHAGHVLFFEDAKQFGDILVAMIGSDAVQKRMKGNSRPILNEHLRLKMVDSIKPVDYAFLDAIPEEGAPQLAFVDFAITNLQPDFYVINDDAFDIPFRQEFMKKHPGTKMITLPRTCPPEFETVSTTSLIEKIKNTPALFFLSYALLRHALQDNVSDKLDVFGFERRIVRQKES